VNGIFNYPDVNNLIFMADWNAGVPSIKIARIHKLKSVLRVNCYVTKLRKEGYFLESRVHKKRMTE